MKTSNNAYKAALLIWYNNSEVLSNSAKQKGHTTNSKCEPFQRKNANVQRLLASTSKQTNKRYMIRHSIAGQFWLNSKTAHNGTHFKVKRTCILVRIQKLLVVRRTMDKMGGSSKRWCPTCAAWIQGLPESAWKRTTPQSWQTQATQWAVQIPSLGWRMGRKCNKDNLLSVSYPLSSPLLSSILSLPLVYLSQRWIWWPSHQMMSAAYIQRSGWVC